MEKSCKGQGGAAAGTGQGRIGRAADVTAKTQPIIVIKRKGGHGGHHGGAWKVAYADFVTAMMSLFIVLWLMNSSEKVKKAVAGYFNDPKGTGTHDGHNDDGHRRDSDGGQHGQHAEAEGEAGAGDQGEEGSGEAFKAD